MSFLTLSILLTFETKINNYIALSFRKSNRLFISVFLLKSVKIIDFSISEEIFVLNQSLILNKIEIKPNDLLVSVS